MWPPGGYGASNNSNPSASPVTQGGGQSEQIGGALTTIAVNGGNIAQLIGKLIEALQTILPFGGSFGSVTLGAAATTTVTDANVKTNSFIGLMPTNAAAGTLVGSAKSPYISTRTANTSFVIATASGGAAAGTETFYYIIVNPST